MAIHFPIEITVFKTLFPQPSMHFWRTVDDAKRSQFVDYLQARNVDTPWASGDLMHWKNLDAQGDATLPLDTSAMERWLAEWPKARRLRVFLSVGNDIAGIPQTDERFTHAVATWVKTWAAEIRRLRKSPDQFDLLLVDEPQTDAAVHTVQTWAQAIRDSGAGFRIWTDVVAGPLVISEGAPAAADTVALNLAVAVDYGDDTSWAQSLSQAGKMLEIYALFRSSAPHGPVYLLSPGRTESVPSRRNIWNC